MKHYFILLFFFLSFINCSNNKNKEVEIFTIENNSIVTMRNYTEPFRISLNLKEIPILRDSVCIPEIPKNKQYEKLDKNTAFLLEKLFINVWNYSIKTKNPNEGYNPSSLREYPKEVPIEDYLVYGKLNLQKEVESILILKFLRGFPEDPEFNYRNLYLINIKNEMLCSVIYLSSLAYEHNNVIFLTIYSDKIFYKKSYNGKTNYLTSYLPVPTIAEESDYETRTMSHSRYIINKDGFVEFLKD